VRFAPKLDVKAPKPMRPVQRWEWALPLAALTLLVLSVVIRVAGRVTVADRRMLRALVGTLCATSVVVVISAIHRMWLYQQA
jgi:hypothetical protein